MDDAPSKHHKFVCKRFFTIYLCECDSKLFCFREKDQFNEHLWPLLISEKQTVNMATLHGRDLMSFRVVDLKDELEKRGLSKSGAKKELAERLGKYLLEHEKNEEGSNDEESNESTEAGGQGAEGSVPPTMKIDTKLEENDIVREYMMLRESQYKSAVEEKEEEMAPVAKEGLKADEAVNDEAEDQPLKSPERLKSPQGSPRKSSPVKQPAEAKEEEPLVKDQEDEPLIRPKRDSPRKRRGRGASQEDNTVESPKSKQPEEPSKPAEKPSKPAKEPSNPVEEPSKPVEKPSKPVEEPSKPTAEKKFSKSEQKAEEAVDEIVVSEQVTFDEKDDKEPTNKEDEEEDSVPTPVVQSNESSMDGGEADKKEPVTFRKLSRLGSNTETRKKRQWGDSNKTQPQADETRAVSSSELKDIIPDINPVLEELKNEVEEKEIPQKSEEKEKESSSISKDEQQVDQVMEAAKDLPKPFIEDAAEIQEKLAPVSEKNTNQSTVVEIRNLVRPFTNNQLVGLLKRTGAFDAADDFWIDKIKSHAMVKYETAQQAEETVLALDGVKWPSSNQKKLIVTFTSNEQFDRQSKEAVSLKKFQPPDSSSSNNKRSAPVEADDSERDKKRPRKDSEAAKKEEDQQQPKKEHKSLEVLFKKTKALPSIYWMPKSTTPTKTTSSAAEATTTTMTTTTPQ